PDRPGGGQTRPATRGQLAQPGQDHGGTGSPQNPRRNAARLLFGSGADKNPRRRRRGSQHFGGAYPVISRALPDLTSAPTAVHSVNQREQSSARSLRRRSDGSRR